VPELVAADGARFVLADAEVLVGRRSDDGSFHPDVDLGALQGGRTVSRRHARIFRSDRGWMLKVEAHARNATAVAGHQLGHQQETALRDGDEIKLGTVSVVFRTNREPPPSDANATIVGIGPGLPAAELRAGDLVVALNVAEGRVLTLGRHSEDRRYRPDVDLRGVPGGSTISRRHADLFRQGSGWFLRVQADVTNPTYLNGSQLQPQQEAALHDGDELRLGRAAATFHAFQQARYVDSDVLQLTVGPPAELTIEPGTQQTLPLTLTNFSGQVDWFVFEVAGAPSNWLRVVIPNAAPGAAPMVRLLTSEAPVAATDATAKVALECAPPRQADARAGTYPLLVTATSQGGDRMRRSATAQLVVLSFVDLGLLAEPIQVRGGHGRYALRVRNAGNTPTCVSFTVATDDRTRATLDFEQITLTNGGEAPVRLDVRRKRRPWFGPECTHSIRITASAEKQVAAQDVQLVCPPRIPLWAQTLLGRVQSLLKPVLIPLAVLAVALGVGYLVMRPPDVKLRPTPPIVASGAGAVLSWDVDRGSGTATLEGPAGSQQVALPGGALNVTPMQTAEYKLTAHNWFGLIGTSNVSIAVVRVLTFTPSVDAIKQEGDPVTLQWTTENATSVSIDPADEIPSPGLAGKAIVHPTASTTYHLTASNDTYRASASADAVVSFGKPKITKFEPDRQQAYPGDAIELTWIAQGFNKLTLGGSPDDMDLATDQDVTRRTTFQVRPLRSADYTLIATNPDGTTDEAHVTVPVVPLKPPRLQAPLKPISAGESAVLTLQAEGVNDRTAATLKPDIGDVSGKTTVEVRPTHTTQYTLTVTSADGQTQSSDPVTVAVLPTVQQFTAVPGIITEGEPVQLSWKVAEADSVTVTRDDGVVVAVGAASDEARDHPTASTASYSLKAKNASGDSIDSPNAIAKVKVQAAPTPTPTPLPTSPPPSVTASSQ
jgi:pSer/pThr/pTyr-binding forkhead associated (FHA) protein